MTDGVEFRILGPVEVYRAGHGINLGGAKQRTVLAALLLAAGRPISDDRLITMLWGWEPPATVDAQIHTYVSRLRKALGPDVLLVRKGRSYALDIRDATLDLDEFETLTQEGRVDLANGRHEQAASRLTEALRLWRGPALANVTDELTQDSFTTLEEARIAALELRIDVDIRLGRHRDLVGELYKLVTQYPMLERFRAQLMFALYRCRRRPEALAVYREGVVLLASELGVDPSDDLSALHRAILAGEVDDAPADGPGTAFSSSAHAPRMLPAIAADFVGREGRLAELVAHLRRDLTADSPNAAVITGLAGVGKSALVVRAAHECLDDFPDGVLYADLGGQEARRDLNEVLGWFLTTLGAATRELAAAPAERLWLWREVTADRRLLVVLDDVADDRQLDVLSPAGIRSRLIATGRRLTGGGVWRIGLDPLTDSQLDDLLGRIVGRDRLSKEPVGAARVLAVSAGLPGAIRAAGAQLLCHPQWTLERAATWLCERGTHAPGRWEHAHEDYLRLSAEARAVLLRLVESPAEVFSLQSAATIVGCDDFPVVERRLEALIEKGLLGLIERRAAWPKQYVLSPLIRLMALEHGRYEAAAFEGSVGSSYGRSRG